MNGFFAKPSFYRVIRAAFVTVLVINLPMWVYALGYAIDNEPLVGMPIQPFDGACDMALGTAFLLLIMIGFLDRGEKLLRGLGIIQILGSLSVTAFPKF